MSAVADRDHPQSGQPVRSASDSTSRTTRPCPRPMSGSRVTSRTCMASTPNNSSAPGTPRRARTTRTVTYARPCLKFSCLVAADLGRPHSVPPAPVRHAADPDHTSRRTKAHLREPKHSDGDVENP